MEVLVIGIKEMQINEEITDKEVRLISNDGEQLGIVSAAQAQKLAAEKNLDLVKIAPQASRPSVRSWTTANIVLSSPRGRRKRRRISV